VNSWRLRTASPPCSTTTACATLWAEIPCRTNVQRSDPAAPVTIPTGARTHSEHTPFSCTCRCFTRRRRGSAPEAQDPVLTAPTSRAPSPVVTIRDDIPWNAPRAAARSSTSRAPGQHKSYREQLSAPADPRHPDARHAGFRRRAVGRSPGALARGGLEGTIRASMCARSRRLGDAECALVRRRPWSPLMPSGHTRPSGGVAIKRQQQT